MAAIEIVPLAGDLFLIAGDPSRRAWAVSDGPRTWVFLDGRSYVVEHETTRRRSGHLADEETALAAPMPATVTAVRVAPGDRVTRGEVLLTLEAMKMVLAIAAPRDGVVKTVTCRPGDLVEAGVPLLELEPASVGR